jgi:hypothetical protein
MMTHELPMVAEWEASGRVQAVFADIRRAFPYVPLVFRALAIQPAGLEVIWGHARQMLHEPRLIEATINLEQAAKSTMPLVHLPLQELNAPREEALRAIFSHFAQTLPVHLLLVTSVGQAMAGDVSGDPLTRLELPMPGQLPLPDFDLLEPDDAPEPLRHRFRQIRALLGLPYIEAPWRVLATDPALLETVWAGVSRYLDRDGFHQQEQRAAERVRRHALELAPALIASPEAFAEAGCADALPALRRMVSLMAAGLLRHTVLSLAVAAAVEVYPAQAA